MSPALAGGGYSSEAISFAQGLVPLFKNKFGMRQFAEQANEDFAAGLPGNQTKLVKRAMRRGDGMRAVDVVVCHSPPDAWVPSLYPGWDAVAPCPPPGARYAVGRTMYETDGVPPEWVARCNALDEVWVPTDFHAATFAAAGVPSSKLRVVGEAIDAEGLFDPGKHSRPLELGGDAAAAPFRFLSVFKWERRKGWDALLAAYFAEFGADEAVELLLKTRPFHSDDDFDEKIDAFATERGLGATRPAVRVLDSELPLELLPRLYRTADAFVLPSRGEGWGRPHVEAMAMGLPVIATNWSGPTAFLDESVGYPLEYTLGPAPDDSESTRGHQWAEPSVPELRRLMRRVFEHRDEARRRGARARERMLREYSPSALADTVLAEATRLVQAAPSARARSRRGARDEL